MLLYRNWHFECFISINLCECACIHMFMFACACECIHMCIHMCMHTGVHVYVSKCMYVSVGRHALVYECIWA